jgi:hypothetical protein
MSRLVWLTAFILMASLVAAGCESTHEKGVKSNVRTQWTDVAVDTQKATDAAKAVLEAEGVHDVKSNATNFDGEVTGKMADGTKVTVTVKKQDDTKSQVSVNIGTMGSPSAGAEIAKKIKARAEGT